MIRINLRETDWTSKRAGWSHVGSSACWSVQESRSCAPGRERRCRDGSRSDGENAGRHLVTPTSCIRPPVRGPAVVFWPDIFGLRPSMRQMGKRLAESGYSVLVPDPFYRTQKSPTAAQGAATPIKELMPLAQGLTETTHMTDAKAFIAWLDSAAVGQQESRRSARRAIAWAARSRFAPPPLFPIASARSRRSTEAGS